MLATGYSRFATFAMFFCKHHCDVGEHDVGGVRFQTIYEEYERFRALADQGQSRIGIATFSSCHGILNVYDLVQAKKTRPARAVGASSGADRRTKSGVAGVTTCRRFQN